MIEKLQQRMKEEIAKLPKDKQQAINALDWGKISEEIAKKALLTENEVSVFQLETGLALIGLVDLDQYARNIENNVGMSAEDAQKMTDEVLAKIFIPIINSMESSVKATFGTKKQSWDDTVRFILSGGDYSNFMDK